MRSEPPRDLKAAASPELTESLTSWMRSGSADVPPLIQNEVAARLAWQERKAVISALLLVVVVALSVVVWRSVIVRSRAGNRVLGRVLAGSVSVLASFLVILMVMGTRRRPTRRSRRRCCSASGVVPGVAEGRRHRADVAGQGCKYHATECTDVCTVPWGWPERW